MRQEAVQPHGIECSVLESSILELVVTEADTGLNKSTVTDSLLSSRELVHWSMVMKQ